MDFESLLSEADPARDISIPGHDSPAARQAFDRQMASATGARTHRRPIPPRAFWPARRLALASLALTAVTVAGTAAALVAVPGHTAPPVARSGVPVISLTAARFLNKAAVVVLRRNVSAGIPQPGQFVYSETEDSSGAKSRYWMSADGSKRSVLEYAGQPANVQAPCTIAQAENKRCYPEVGYFPDMPTDPRALLAYLNDIELIDTHGLFSRDTAWKANDIGKAVDELMPIADLLPAQQAALYQLMARTPGFTIMPHVIDAAGRVGVGVAWRYEGVTSAIILDPVTYAYLGDTGWNNAGQFDETALIQMAIVTRAGQLP